MRDWEVLTAGAGAGLGDWAAGGSSEVCWGEGADVAAGDGAEESGDEVVDGGIPDWGVEVGGALCTALFFDLAADVVETGVEVEDTLNTKLFWSASIAHEFPPWHVYPKGQHNEPHAGRVPERLVVLNNVSG